MKALKLLFEIDKAHITIYQPTFDMVRKIMYPRFEEVFGDAGIQYKLNKSEGIITVHNIGTILFRSLENPDRIIGFETHHSFLDELDTLDADKAEEVYMKALGRNRKKIVPRNNKRGVCLHNTMNVTTTPEGMRFVYRKWKKNPHKDYVLLKAKTHDNIYLPKDYIENLRQSYPPQLIEAYMNGEFVNMETGTVYPNFDIDKNRSFEKLSDNREAIHIGMDFNVNNMNAVIGVKRYGKLLILEEINGLRDTPAMIDEILNRYATGRKIIVYPDASGRSSKSVDASRSDISLIRESGITINAPKKNPPVRNRIVNVNTLLLNAAGQRNLLINTDNCPNLVDALLEQSYLKNGDPDKSGTADDINDALGYLVTRAFGLNRPSGIVSRFRF